MFLIWSNKHSAWWGPDHCGYVGDSRQAGRYSAAEAGAIVVGSGFPNENVAVVDVPGVVAYWLARPGREGRDD